MAKLYKIIQTISSKEHLFFNLCDKILSSSTDLEIFRNPLWKDKFEETLANITNYVQVENDHPPPIVYFFSLLDLVKEKKLYHILLNKFRSKSENVNRLKPFITILELIESLQSQTIPNIDLLLNYQSDPEYQNFWLQDALSFLIEFYKQYGDEQPQKDSNIFVHEYKDIWWQWKHLSLNVNHYFLSADWKNFNDAMNKLEHHTTENKLEICLPYLWITKGRVYRYFGTLDKCIQLYRQASKVCSMSEFKAIAFLLYSIPAL